ncbi:uncharacterized protein B0J16DRAFT_396216 [Fusarium flagelliforme]|uniref:uncharacterized protein n=1 Tax=Fusarium flagelliforme TaxID=2675880 RepID=UPI001E8EC2EE|nr:uncharacterized protein B0J16DRAFT_396216 [Fusarium flagelliforme]KAH7188059.1 hypothetical protein B0J16DRAFT_396216 [Fusarium flagelliforme]
MLFSRLLSKPVIQLQPATWDSPEESLGALVGPLHGGRYKCWEAAGRARAVFTDLSAEIKGYLEASTISTCDIISWSMYMIGRTAETAAPKVLICSINSKVRKSIRKSIEYSGIMDKYPGIGLGDTSTLPDRHVIRLLSRETIKTLLLLRKCEPELAVLVESTPASRKKINKRRAFVVDPADYSLRPITLGPLITAGGKSYLLTAAHAFSTKGNLSESQSQHQEAFDDCSFDGMSEDEDKVDLNTLETGTPSSFASQLFAMINPFSNPELPGIRASPLNDKGIELDREPHDVDVSRLRFYGKLALSSATGNRPALDYALIEEKRIENTAVYRIQDLEPPPIQANEIETIGTQDGPVIAYLGDSGGVTGGLTATPTYMYFPGWRHFQEVYPVRFHNHEFCAGDSGAGVFRHNGSFLGHIVAGGPGTHIAYIVPAIYTMANIDARLNEKLSSINAFLGMISPDVTLADSKITLNKINQILRDIFHHFPTSKVTSMILMGVVTLNLLGRYLELFDNNHGWRWVLGSMIFHSTSTLPLILAVATAYIAGRLENHPPRISVILKVIGTVASWAREMGDDKGYLAKSVKT